MKSVWSRPSAMKITGSLVLLVFVLLMSLQGYPLEWKGEALLWLTGLDPWMLLNQLYHQQSVPVWAWSSGLILLSALLWGRVFCGWLCPLGALLAWSDSLGRRLPRSWRRGRQTLLSVLRPYRYLWLLLWAVVFFISSNWALFLTPFTLLGHETVLILQGGIPWVLLGLILAAFFLGRFWCSHLCPTGLLLSLVGRLRRYGYQTDTGCISCGKCQLYCPVDAAPGSAGGAGEWCLVCGQCQVVCPVEAVQWRNRGLGGEPSEIIPTDDQPGQLSRRRFVGAAALGLAGLALWQTLWLRAVEASDRVLRPPGARPEDEFSQLCSRCGRCLQVCPTRALWAMPLSTGWADFETPEFIPRRGRCDLCMACQEVCPTGAIMMLPMEEVDIGTAVVDQDRCLAWSQGKLCFLCGEQCPFQAISGDDQVRPTVIDDLCVGCGACEYGCPVEGEAAIRVFPGPPKQRGRGRHQGSPGQGMGQGQGRGQGQGNNGQR